MENLSWNGWKSQSHWDKFEWVSTRSDIEGKDKFYLYSKTFHFKRHNITTPWFGYSKLTLIDLDFFLKKIFLMR